MSSQEIPASTLTFTCLCHAVTYKPTYKHSDTLPLPAEFCHCNTCRRSSGAICGAFVELTDPPPAEILAQCTEYKSSEKVRRYFCSQCGSHLFLRGWSEDNPTLWFVWAGNLERADDDNRMDVDTIKVTMQCYVNDTMDGGLVGRMIEVAAMEKNPSSNVPGEGIIKENDPLANVYADIWFGTKMSTSDIEALVAESKTREDRDSDRLDGECHCGSIKFCLTKPFPLEQYDEQTRNHLRHDPTRYPTGTCLCRSCRASTGNPIHTWTWVPPQNVVTTSGEPVDFFMGEKGMKSLGPALKQYKTSAPVTWYFCGTCGATIFYEADNRDYVIDISIGVFRSKMGALARDFLRWEWDEDITAGECRIRKLMESVDEDMAQRGLGQDK